MNYSKRFDSAREAIKSVKGANKNSLKVTVSLTDTEIFDQLKDLYVEILGDERIEENIREEYYSRLEKMFDEIFKKKEKK